MIEFNADRIETILKMVEARFGENWHQNYSLATSQIENGQIHAILSSLNLAKIDWNEVNHLVEHDVVLEEDEVQSTYEQLLSDFKELEIIVRWVEKDMKALLTVRPGTLHPVLTPEDIGKILEKEGVVYGIKEDTVLKLCGWPIKETLENIVVAKGTEPTPSENAKIKVLFPKDGFITVELGETEQKDHANIRKIFQCKAGDVLVEKTPLVQGEDGTTVRGNKIAAAIAKDVFLKQLIGNEKTVQISQDGRHLIALRAGQPYLSNLGKVFMQEVFVVDKNLDYSVGNIDFDGTVIIKGNVEVPFEVHAKGDIIIEGLVVDTTIISEQSIFIKQGTSGKGRGKILAKKSVTSRFFNETIVIADQDVISEDYILNSTILCGGNLLICGRGIVTGGCINAGGSISIHTAGSRAGIPTMLAFGIDYIQRRFEMEKAQRISEYLRKISLLATAIKQLSVQIEQCQTEEQHSGLTHQMAKITLTKRKYFSLIQQAEQESLKRTSEIQSISSRSNEPFLSVQERAYEGVIIQYGHEIFKLPSEVGPTIFKYDQSMGRFIARPIDTWKITGIG